MKKNILALIMAVAMIFTMALPSFASSTPAQTKYSVTVLNENGAHGNVSIDGTETQFAEGDTVTLVVDPDDGYDLTNGKLYATVNGASNIECTQGTGDNANKYTFTMPGTTVKIYPEFSLVDYTVTLTVGSNGAASLSEDSNATSVTANYYDDINIYATPATDYEIDKITVNNTPITGTSFKMPAENVDVNVSFKVIDYNITLNYNTNMCTVTSDVKEAQRGQPVSLTIEPKDGYRFVSAIANHDGTGSTTGISLYNNNKDGEFLMPASNVTVNVVFEKIPGVQHNITVASGIIDGDIDFSVVGKASTATTAEQGDIVRIYATPDTKYYDLESLSVSNVTEIRDGYKGYYEFVMPNADVVIDATFYEPDYGPYDIDVVESDDGDYRIVVKGGKSELSIEKDTAFKHKNSTADWVYIYVTPDNGYKVDYVSIDGATATYEYDESLGYARFKMPKNNVEVSIYYEEDDDYVGDGAYDITTSYSSSKGKITVQDSADYGEKVYVTVKPKTGYVLDEIEVIEERDEETVKIKKSSATKYYFTMPKDDVIIIATFTRGDSDDDDSDDYYDIFVAESDHGDVNVDDSAEAGDTVKIKIEEDYGYKVDEIIVSRASSKTVTVTKKSTYWQFTMPSGDVFIEVTYKRGSSSTGSNGGDYDIDLYYNDDYGYVDVVDSADASEKVYLYIEPNDDCEVDEIVITRTNGNTVSYKYSSSNDYYYFTMPSSDVEIEVTFVGEPSDDDDDDNDDGYHSIILDYDDDAGIVEVDDEAEEGEKVYIELELDADYSLDKIRVFEYSTGEAVTVKKSSNTKYYFTMPEDDVFIIVTFDCDDYEDEDTYRIDIESNDTDLGTADVSTTYAAKGERVLVIIDPDSEYAVSEIIAERTNGLIVTVKQITSFCYEFTMPGYNVDVTVYFDEDRPLSYKEIALTYDKKMGEVYLSDEYAEEDDDINVYVEPKDGYEVASVSVKRTNGNKKVTCSKNKYGDYVFTMPDADVTVTVTFKKVEVEEKEDPKPTTPDPTLPSEPTVHLCPAQSYTDVDATQWYHEHVDYVIAYNLMSGWTDITGKLVFGPNDVATRAMIVTVLWRIAGQPSSTALIPYTDVTEPWYTEAVRWAAANGLLTNVAPGTVFEPNAQITREQFASMFYNFQKLYGRTYKNDLPTSHYLTFADKNLISDWAYVPMTWCNEYGIFEGMGNNEINPHGPVTRAQFAKILNAYNKLDK